jgi:phosphomethylpyrimidine synthase
MKITQDVREYAEQQGIIEIDVAIAQGMEEKAKEFTERGGEVYLEV